MRLFGGSATDRSVDAPSDAQRSAGAAEGDTRERRVPLGETGFDIFPLIIGAAEFGWNVDLENSHAILDRYLECGGNAVHTADGYSGGRSEYIVGEWMRTRGLRETTVLCARVGAHPDNPGLGSTNLVRAVEASLTRLQVECIDVLYLDATIDDSVHLEDALATVEWLRESGKLRSVAAYGFTAEQLVEARILASAGYPRVEVIDEPYNMLRRKSFEGDIRLVASAQGLAVTPSHALEHGFLSGRHRSKSVAGAGVRGVQLRSQLNRRGNRALRALDEVANEVSAPVAAVSIAWLLAQRAVVAPIVNTFATEHVDELVQAAGVVLSRLQLAELSKASG